MEAWERPEAYWHDKSPSYPTSPGWSDQEQKDVATLRERARELAAKIVTHAFWNEIAGPDRPDARSKLKHAVEAETARARRRRSRGGRAPTGQRVRHR